MSYGYWLLLKEKFYNTCLTALREKADTLMGEVEQLRISIANDSKSSMGDKYETSREMMQQEINRLEQQVSLSKQQIFNLESINIKKKSETVEKGSLVETTLGLFFISISFGEIKLADKACFMISEHAPLAKLLLKKKVQAKFEINKKEAEIIGIY